MPRMRGPVPLLGTIRAEFPYTAVAAVETREEVYNGCGITSLHRAYSVVTRAGVRISLGSMDQNRGFQLPFDQAAARIAARAGISVTDRGTVLVGGILRAIANDSLPWSAQALSPAEREAWRRRAILTAWLLLMAVAGILFLRFFAG